jgi:hypothetical protein
MHLEVVPPAGLLDLLEVEHVQQEGVVDIAADEHAADLVKEKLFGDGKDGAGRIAVDNDYLNGVLVAVVIHVLFNIILVRVKPF